MLSRKRQSIGTGSLRSSDLPNDVFNVGSQRRMLYLNVSGSVCYSCNFTHLSSTFNYCSVFSNKRIPNLPQTA